MRKINFCFKFLKELYFKLNNTKNVSSSNNNETQLTQNHQPNITIVDSSHYDTKETKELKETLKQRDNEISILVNMLKKEKKKINDLSTTTNPAAL